VNEARKSGEAPKKKKASKMGRFHQQGQFQQAQWDLSIPAVPSFALRTRSDETPRAGLERKEAAPAFSLITEWNWEMKW
jgi:hypothetical protein